MRIRGLDLSLETVFKTFRFRFARIAIDGAKVIADLLPANRGLMMAVSHREMKL